MLDSRLGWFGRSLLGHGVERCDNSAALLGIEPLKSVDPGEPFGEGLNGIIGAIADDALVG